LQGGRQALLANYGIHADLEHVDDIAFGHTADEHGVPL